MKVEESLASLRGKSLLPKNIDKLLEVGIFKRSVLFSYIFDTLDHHEGNKIDKLRRYGLGLDQTIRKRGVFSGNRTCMLNDYKDITDSFVRAWGDRRP